MKLASPESLRFNLNVRRSGDRYPLDPGQVGEAIEVPKLLFLGRAERP